jgi:hypothetical protein
VQLALPAGFHPGGRRFATLREVLDEKTPTLDGSALAYQQLVRLTVARLRGQPRFHFVVLGHGALGKTRAIAAVRDQTALGRFLTTVERRAIELARVRFGPPRRAGAGR